MSLLSPLSGKWWRTKQRAFTLIELLLVISLIAFLISRFAPAFHKGCVDETLNAQIGGMQSRWRPATYRRESNESWSRPAAAWMIDSKVQLDDGSTDQTGGEREVFHRIAAKVCINPITSETSNTILAGVQVPYRHYRFSGGSWAGFTCVVPPVGMVVPINSKEVGSGCGGTVQIRCNKRNESWGFKSGHSSGCNFAFVDGSVRFLSDSIEMRTFQVLGCRNDNQPVTFP